MVTLVSVTGAQPQLRLSTYTGTPTVQPGAYRAPVPYPPRPHLRPLPEFRSTASPRPDPAVQARVETFIVEQYQAGRSLRQLAELTDRSFSAVRNILTRHRVHRRHSGASVLREIRPLNHGSDAGQTIPYPSIRANARLRGAQ